MFDSETRAARWGPGHFGWSQRSADDVVVVRLAGELDLSTWAELRRRLLRVAESGPAATIVLDMSDVRFIDAHSAGLIVTACVAAQVHGRMLRVDGLRGIPARVFGLLELEPMLVRRAPEDGPGGYAGGRSNGRRSAGGTHETR